jgi:hypothetical protein
MGVVNYPLPPGNPIRPSTWDGYHDIVYPSYLSYAYERDWCAIRFSLPTPLDRAMTPGNIDWMFRYAIWTGIKVGGPLRAMLWYRTRVSGLYNYELYLEYAGPVAPGAMSYAIWGCLVLVVKDMSAILDYNLSESGTIATSGPPPPPNVPPPPMPTPTPTPPEPVPTPSPAPVIPIYPDDGGNGTISTSNMLPYALLGGAALLAIYALRES